MRHHCRLLPAIFTVALIALLSVTTGCRSTSKAVSAGGNDASAMTLTERFRDVASGYQPWVQLNLPVKVTVKSPKRVSLSGRIYMRRDRDIYITLRVLGMEVANMYVNSDSIYAADKLHKLYIAEPIKDIFAGASLSIGDIQDALSGRVFINNSGTFNEKSLNRVTLSTSPDDTWTITPKSKIGGKVEYQFRFANDDNSLISLIFKAAGKLYGCTYADPSDTDAGRFMQRLNISTAVGKTDIDATLTFDFGKLKQEVPSSARWRTNSSYRRINPQALAKAFEEL